MLGDWRALTWSSAGAGAAGRLDGSMPVSRPGAALAMGDAGWGLLASKTASESAGAAGSPLGPEPSSSMSAIFSSSVRRCAEPGAAALSASDKLEKLGPDRTAGPRSGKGSGLLERTTGSRVSPNGARPI
jgi:hypothetical protein